LAGSLLNVLNIPDATGGLGVIKYFDEM